MGRGEGHIMKPETMPEGSEQALTEKTMILILQAKEAVQTAQRHLRAAVENRKNEYVSIDKNLTISHNGGYDE